jgi:hypothetical protein
MKLTNLLFIVAIFGSTLFISCTPESVEDGQTEQQVDKTLKPLQNG